MGISVNVMEAIIRDRAHAPFRGKAYTLGRQTMATTPRETFSLFNRLGVESALGVEDLGVDKTTHFAINYARKETIRDVDFFRMLGLEEIYALDISDFEGAEIIVDLNEPIRPALENSCGLLVDGSTLDNIFDPCTGLKNIARMMAPGGRCFLVNMGNASDEFTGVPYTMFNPLWFFDYFAWNNFAYCQVYISIYPPDMTGPPMVYALSFEHAMRMFDGGIIRPILSKHTIALTVYAEKGEDSTWDQKPIQHAYRTEDQWARYSEIVAGYHAQQRPHLQHSARDKDPHPIPSGWLRIRPDGSQAYTDGS